MNNYSIKLTVLRSLYNDKLFRSFVNAYDSHAMEDFYYELYDCGAENDFMEKLCSKILLNENAFSRTCANGNTPSAYLLDAYIEDLDKIFNAAMSFSSDEHFNLGNVIPPFDSEDNERTAANLIDYYAAHGYGQFIVYKAFTYENGQLTPIPNTSSITLNELKNYEGEKKQIDDNLTNFINSLPYANMLLYGDRGTGKSSTIHAMLNKYFEDGLRIIEIDKENISSIAKIRELIADTPLKFIVFIDDISLSECDDKISVFKVGLEGSVSNNNDNMMIVATSNRRHIIKENFSDRENAIHPGDSMAEQLSLSDRFGLTVLFSNTGKEQYLSIVEQLADDRNLTTDRSELKALAERWAIIKGGRSPRRAKQFIDFVYACLQRNSEIEF